MRRRAQQPARSRLTEEHRHKLFKPDFLILLLTTVFLIFGIIMIFDASVYNADQYFNDRFYFVKQQAIWIILGIAAGGFLYFWDYHQFTKFAFPLLLFSVFLLVLVLLIGTERNGAVRWLDIGGISIQPAELVKPAFVLYLSLWLSKERKAIHDLRQQIRYHVVYELSIFLVLLGIVGGLVVIEPDLGTAVIICVVAFGVYFSSGRDWVHSVGSVLVVVMGLLFGIGAIMLESYRLDRLNTLVQLQRTGEVAEPLGSGYQTQQILIGIGSGGFWGKGFGESRQRFGYLVADTAFTDSIYAIILEELGMFGGLVLASLFLVLLSRAYRIAIRAPDRLGQLLAGGIGFWLVFQAFLHMAANVALVPVTGVPLPFFTYGGSSTVVALAGMGILLNVSRHVET
jgi:cell division protein FtsW